LIIKKSLLKTFLILILLSCPLFAAEENTSANIKYYAVTTPELANIYSQPAVTADKVVTVKKNSVFEITAQNEQWYQVKLFTNQPRFIQKNNCVITNNYQNRYVDNTTKQLVFKSFIDIEMNCQLAAQKVYPNDYRENQKFEQLLLDRVKTKQIAKFGLNVPDVIEVRQEGDTLNWERL